MALKSINSESFILQNSKFETELNYYSSRISIALIKYNYHKSRNDYTCVGRIDFVTAEALSIITLLIASSNTAKPLEYAYPTKNIKFSTNVSNDYITVKKQSYNKDYEKKYEEKDSMQIHLNEMPAVILMLYRALINSTMVNWQTIQPAISPKQPSRSVQEIINEILKGKQA